MRTFFYCFSLLYSGFVLVQLFSCTKRTLRVSDQEAVESTDTTQGHRVEAIIALLAGAPNGWNVCICDKDSNHYHFWMHFDTSQHVQMRAACYPFIRKGGQIQRSTYAAQQNRLTFHAHNYLTTVAKAYLHNTAPGPYTFIVDASTRSAALASVSSFTVHSLTDKTITATFTKVSPRAIPVAMTVLSAQHKFDSLRWAKGHSVNIVSNLRVNHMTEEYMYDLHPQFDTTSIYPSVIAFTSLRTRTGAAFQYYFDCEGKCRFRPAGKNIPVRQRFVDKAFEQHMSNAYLHAFAWEAGKRGVTLIANKHTLHTDAPPEQIRLSSQSILCAEKKTKTYPTRNLPHKASTHNHPTQDNYHLDSVALFAHRFNFFGFTVENKRNAWQSPRYHWQMEHATLRAFSPGNEHRISGSALSVHNGRAGTALYFANNMSRLTRNTSLGFLRFERAAPNAPLLYFRKRPLPEFTKATEFGGAYEAIRDYMLQNSYTILPTILGFDLHRTGGWNLSVDFSFGGQDCGIFLSPTGNSTVAGVVIPLYLTESIAE